MQSKRSLWMARKSQCVFILLCLLLFFIGCAEVPLTHRKGLRLLPTSQMLSLSRVQYKKVLKESRGADDQQDVEMVKRVGKRIAEAAELFLEDCGLKREIKNYNWEFNLIKDDKVVNAWCMPGGKVAVYTGILPIAKDDTGLAVVLGHEVAHAIARHGNERMSQALLVNMGGMALSVAVSEKPAETRRLFLTVFGVGSTVAFMLPYSRVHESEADRIGLRFMSMAGYDPREAVCFWERMTKKAGGRPPEFLSTHPAPASRIADIWKFIDESLPYYKRAVK